MSQRSEKLRVRSWLAVFIVVPESVWLTASLREGFREKKVSNLTLEPLAVALLSLAVFGVWFLMSRKGLRPFAGLILLILVSAAALAIQRYVPGLHE